MNEERFNGLCNRARNILVSLKDSKGRFQVGAFALIGMLSAYNMEGDIFTGKQITEFFGLLWEVFEI